MLTFLLLIALLGTERMDILSAERALNNSNTTNKNSTNTSAGSTTGSSSASVSSSGSSIPFVELVVETDTNNQLPGYEATALTDPIVLQYTTSNTTANSDGEEAEGGAGMICLFVCVILPWLFEFDTHTLRSIRSRQFLRLSFILSTHLLINTITHSIHRHHLQHHHYHHCTVPSSGARQVPPEL